MKGQISKPNADAVYFAFNHVEGGRNVTFQNGTSDTITVEVTNQNIQRTGLAGATWSTPANGSTTIPVDAVKGIIGPNAFVRLSGAGTGSIYYAYTEKDDAADIDGVNLNFNSQNYQRDGERFPLNEFLTITRSSVANSAPTSSGELVQYAVDELPFKYVPSVGKAGALFEGAATNLLTLSGDLASYPSAGWSSFILSSSGAGVPTADTFVEVTDANGFKGQVNVIRSKAVAGERANSRFSLSVTAGVTYTVSLYFDVDRCVFSLSPSDVIAIAIGQGVDVRLRAADIDDDGMLTMTFTPTTTGSLSFSVGAAVASAAIQNQDLYYCLWQAEVGTKETSRILTESTTASRAKTNSIKTDLTAWGYNSAEGSVTIEAYANVGDVLFKAGSFEVIADVDGYKVYEASYTSDPSATQIEVGNDCRSAVIFNVEYKPHAV